jgi:uncharacterized repeat protein (TIGR03803 family)
MKFGPAKYFCQSGLVLLAITVVVSMAAAQETILFSFNGSNGANPNAGLISDSKGNFYGTTVSGGVLGLYGTVFELSPAAGGSWTFTELYQFGNAAGDGTQPLGGLVLDPTGNLYGTTSTGGSSGNGTVYELSKASGGGWTEKILYSFGASPDATDPRRGSLVFDTKGNLYGTTATGGVHNLGAVFELSPAAGGTWTEKVIYSFGASNLDGSDPTNGVVLDAAGNLYGTTDAGGQYGYGTAYELSPAAGGTWTEKLLHTFNINSVDGANPIAGVILDSQGNLFGTTFHGGSFGNGLELGTVYELSPSPSGPWTEQILHSFTGGLTNGDGDYPIGGLVFDAAGNLYGTTSGGGVPAVGTVFELTRSASGWNEKVIYTFSNIASDGSVPYDTPIFDAAGNLYGTTSSGGSNSFGLDGTIFKLANIVTASPTFSPAGGAYIAAQSVKISDATPSATIYYSIDGGASSTKYTGPITVSTSETIAAVAVTTGLPLSQMSVANYQIGTTTATPEFTPTPGTYTLAQSVSIIDAAPGAIIYYTTNGTTPTTSSPKYTVPIGVTATETIKAIAVAKGYINSAVASGTYTITPVVAPTEKMLYSFGASATDGGVPLSNLISDKSGNLYGTTEYGGTHSITYAGVTSPAGTVFELSPETGGGWTEKVLYNFGATTTDAAHPLAGLVFDSKGNLYGTTYQGGTWGLGTVYELVAGTGGSWTEKVLHSFGGTLTDGEVPESNLIFDSAGNLYGTTEAGGAYDTVFGGASNGYGTVFEMSPGTGSTWTEKVLYSFSYLSQTDGYYPMAGLVFDSKGNLYGTTSDGGSGQDLEGGGTVFELTPTGGGGYTEKVLYSFGGGSTNGYQIIGGVVLDAAGNIYGTAYSGGNGFDLDGTLFELSPVGAGWSETVLHSFGAYETDGINPRAGLVFDAAGNLYGTTWAGGANGYGTVFEMKAQTGGGWTETVVHSFNLSATDGANPWASLFLDAAGNIYGTTAFAGAHGPANSGYVGGTVFEIQTATLKTATTTTLASPLNPSTYGQSVTFTATVKASSGMPTGTVTFKNGTATLGSVALSAGVAKYTTATLAVGTNSVTASYAGSATFNSSTSTAVSEAVNKASTTTALVSSVHPSIYGESVTLTATVKPQYTGTPSGTVTFKIGTTTLGSVTLSAGVAKYTTTTLGVGTHSITAVYNGSASFNVGTSTAVSQVVNKATTTTTLTSSANPSNGGESVTFTATVKPQYSGTPGGTVTFKDGTTTLGSVTLSSGVAQYTTTTLAKGTHSISAAYGGSASFATSSARLTQTVN